MTLRPADPRQRRRLLLWLVALVGLALLAERSGWFGLARHLAGLPAAERLERTLWLLRLVVLALLPLGLYLVRFGARVLAAGEFPPPGTPVIRTTRVVTGWRAVARGWALLLLGAAFFPLAYYGAVVVPNTLLASHLAQ